jgi:hypothetical protein
LVVSYNKNLLEIDVKAALLFQGSIWKSNIRYSRISVIRQAIYAQPDSSTIRSRIAAYEMRFAMRRL